MPVVLAFLLGIAFTVGGAAFFDSTRKPWERNLVNWELVWQKR